MPHVVSISLTPSAAGPRPPDRYARVPVPEAVLVAGLGIEGDVKARPGRRQLNVMRAETVAGLAAEGFRTAPGELGEQLVLVGVDPAALADGARLRLGAEAVIEVTYPRTGCGRFARIQGKPEGAAEGRLGVMARVVAGGTVRVGDPVVVA